jgi:hypothetical protein
MQLSYGIHLVGVHLRQVCGPHACVSYFERKKFLVDFEVPTRNLGWRSCQDRPPQAAVIAILVKTMAVDGGVLAENFPFEQASHQVKNTAMSTAKR